MKEEDVDWLVYHRLPESGEVALEALGQLCSLDAATLNASLDRLESSCLIERRQGSVRMLNFGEAILRNQCKYDPGLPYTIENGVIKMKK